MQPALHQRDACCISHEYSFRSLVSWSLLVTFLLLRRTAQPKMEIIVSAKILIIRHAQLAFCTRISGFGVPNLRLPKYLHARRVRSQIKISGAHPFHRGCSRHKFQSTAHIFARRVADVYFYNFVIMINDAPAYHEALSLGMWRRQTFYGCTSQGCK
jgi:hypothetical protein